MKEVIGKTKAFENGILQRMVIDGIKTFDPSQIANGFNKFITEMGPKLASFQSEPFPKISCLGNTQIYSSRWQIIRSF